MIKYLFFLILYLFLTACSHTKKNNDIPELVHIQIVDRNGFNETISSKERLKKFENINFFDPQPYKKVVQFFKQASSAVGTSKIFSYHENGYLYQSLEVLGGRAHGQYREWHPNGSLKLQMRVIEGAGDLSIESINTWVFDGEALVYNENGALEAQFVYDKGLLSGKASFYYPTGALKRVTYYEKNFEEGESVEYGLEGSIIGVSNYLHGKLHGEKNFYGTKSLPKFSEFYDQGVLVSGLYYNLSNQIVSQVNHKSGVISFFSDKGLEAQVEVKNGEKEGFVNLFHKEGVLINSYHQANGFKHGEEILYYSPNETNQSNQPKLMLNWYMGKLQGRVKTWYNQGTLESEREFYDSKKNGPASAFYKSGQLMLLEEYQNDYLQSGLYWKKGDKKEVSRVENGEGIATLYDGDGVFLKRVIYKKGIAVDE